MYPLIDAPSLARDLRLLPAAPARRQGSGPDAGTGPVVLDTRWRLGGPPGIDSYRDGHIPGAVFLDLDRELCGAPGSGGRHPLPPAGDFEQVMRRAGVSTGRPVVVYDDADSTAAARAWWTLRYFGHQDVQVLDGGFRAWAAAGLPVESGEPGEPGTPTEPGEPGDPGEPGVPGDLAAPLGDFTARPGAMPVLDAAAAGGLARSGVLLDARAGERYRGEVEPVDPVAGHIPGAVNAPTAENVRADGVFRDADEIRARFAELGLAPGSGARAAGAYCGSGVTAAHEILALTLAGIPAALYVGSWSEWVTDPARPVAAGPLPG